MRLFQLRNLAKNLKYEKHWIIKKWIVRLCVVVAELGTVSYG